MVIQIGESIEVQSSVALVPMEPYPSIFECVRPYEGRSDAAIGTSRPSGPGHLDPLRALPRDAQADIAL
jgi:hypothetical protein